MDPPQPPPPSPPISAVTVAATYADSIDSSPRSRTIDSYLDDPPSLSSSALSTKLRLMCSYGGHILPRPHDKSLCYVGGDTRIVVVDRHVTLSSLTARLSTTLLNGRDFTLKYQLPSEDLDSLISVTTDEDLENMVDEYDRSNANAVSKQRLRLFLFPINSDSARSAGAVLENGAKTEDWFLDALNGGSGLLNRGFSDSASVNCLLGLDDEAGGTVIGSQKKAQEAQSVPDSPMLETTSSFGSTSSSPSLANLPPIKVHVDQKPVGIEEQFAQINVGGSGGGGGQRLDEGFVALSSPPPVPVSIAVSGVPPAVVGEYQNRGFSDDDRLSDHGVPVGFKKPPQPQNQPQTLPPQQQQKSSGGSLDLPSPDSFSSDSSFSNVMNRQKPVIYQESVLQIPSGGGGNRVSGNTVDPKVSVLDPNARIPVQQQVQDSGYVLQQTQFDHQQQQLQQQQQQMQQQQQQQMQQQPQQFIHAGGHYINYPAGGMPISAYIPVYPPQQQHPHQHQHLHQLDQQYPVYYVPARQPQYNLPVQQSSLSEGATSVPSSRPQSPPNPSMVPSPMGYNQVRNAPLAKPEMAAAGMYRTTTTGTPQLVPVPLSQHQQQYVGYSQVHHPSQSVVPTSASAANYAYEFADPAHSQIYYTQQLAPTMPSQYQTMTAASVVLPEASAQISTDNTKQQMRTSQPI